MAKKTTKTPQPTAATETAPPAQPSATLVELINPTFHPENGNVIQLAQDLVAYVKAAAVMGRWQTRLFGTDQIIQTGYVDQIVRGAVPSYDNLDEPTALDAILSIAAGSGDLAEKLLRVLCGGEDAEASLASLREMIPGAFAEEVAPADEA